MSPQEKDQIKEFFSSINPWINAYSNIGLSYFAVRKDGNINLLQARLFLNVAPPAISPAHIETGSMLAGHVNFAEFGMELQNFVERLVNDGEIDTPLGKFKFPSENGSEYSAYFVPFHQEGIASDSRLSTLKIRGARKYTLIEQPKFDWELKAAPKPFDSLDELLSILALGGNQDDAANIEIVAYRVVEVNYSSAISGAEAKPSIFSTKLLNKSKCQIGYRVFLHGNVVDRGSIQGNDLTWTEQGAYLQGEGQISIPQGAALHCVASYDGHAQHQGWIADPNNSQNSRRVLLEEFHGGLNILRSYLFEEQRRGKDARDFEFGVAWLMWMLGFSPSQVGGRENTSDAADIVATTPSGNILIVECTTGLLKSDKVAKLVERSELIRKRLVLSGNHHLKVQPVIVTSKPKDEVKADIEEVKNKGVAVVTKEDLESALSQTVVLPNSETIFDQLCKAAQPKQNSPSVL